MKYGHYKGKDYIYNEFFMEIYEEGKKGLIKKRDFHHWEYLLDQANAWKEEEHSVLRSVLGNCEPGEINSKVIEN